MTINYTESEAASSNHATASTERGAATPNRLKPTVLVVEDNLEMSRFIADSLSEKYSIVCAYDGQEGLQKALTCDPAAIISDITMSGMSGAQMIAEIRKRPDLDHVPIVLLSAKADEEVKLKLLEDGVAQDFIAKPFAEKDLQVRINNVLRLKKYYDAYRTLFRSMDEGFCTIEVIFDENDTPVDYRFLEVNSAFERQTGLHNAKGRTINELAPGHEKHWFEIYGKVALTGESCRFDNVAEVLGHWYQVYAFRVGKPENRHVAVFFSDITERKLAQRSVEDQSRRQAAIVSVLENSPDFIGMADTATTRVTYLNEAGMKLIGITETAELRRRVMKDFITPDSTQTFERALSTAEATGFWEGEMTFRNFSTGEPVPMYQRVWTVANEKDATSKHFATIASPLSDQKKFEEVLGDLGQQKSINEELQTALEELQNLAYVVSHELQEPLQTIKSYQNLLAVRYRGRLGSDADEFINRCAAASDITQRMVDDLWEYARVNKPSFPLSSVDSNRALGKAVSTLQSLIAETGTRLEHEPLPEVRANETLLATLFVRLLENSIKHRVEGVSPRINIEVESTEIAWVFSIRDNGKGIDPMIGKDVFKLFFRGQGRPGREGTGMGLPIARKIVGYFGGVISFDSQPGLGSTFRFTIPRID